MRTSRVALAYLDNEGAMVDAARQISELTRVDPDTADACVLWCCDPPRCPDRRARRLIALTYVTLVDGQHGWNDPTKPKRRIPPTAPRTDGSSTHCRPPGVRSPPRYGQKTIQRRGYSAPTNCGWRWNPRSAAANTDAAIAGGLLGAAHGALEY